MSSFDDISTELIVSGLTGLPCQKNEADELVFAIGFSWEGFTLLNYIRQLQLHCIGLISSCN